MYRDEIIEEVWKNREAYAASHNHDLVKIVDDLIARQKQSLKKIVGRRSIPDKAADTDDIDSPFKLEQLCGT